jgi:hypothetical protein
MRIFLSYTQSDGAFAKALSSELARRGLKVWSPDEELLPGDNWSLGIGEALKTSNTMVVLVSPDSMRSDQVRREIEYALGDPSYERRVFPVQVRPTKDIPWILRKFQILDARPSVAKVSASIANALLEGSSLSSG